MHLSDIRWDLKNDRILRDLFEKFLVEGTYLEGIPFGSGHIHDTFLIRTAEAQMDDYIFQRFNNNVFREIQKVQENISRVTAHLKKKIQNLPGSDPKRETLTLIPAKNNNLWLEGADGKLWRAFLFIPRHKTYDVVDSPEKAFEGGRIVGRFQAMLSDLEGPPLHETIPFFHNSEKRLETFYMKVSEDPEGRVKFTEPECGFVDERAEIMKTIHHLGREGKIPVRITHNDTKFNNILFDENTERALCIIDLDTVMPGLVHYDFGDAIRTAANTGAEDEKDLSKVEMDIDLFRAYAAGYLSEIKNVLNETETEYIAFAPLVITFIQGVRFLTDYIDGDKYYKIHHENHNLQRARAQFKLVRSMERQYGEMKKIIRELIS
ncbi:MAG: phosphotransferase enzyme family protein [Bacteroidales bacterium]